ncbi:MAG: hypothetical protein ACTSVV_15275 [Promethearchaeota archaeon]
MTINICPRCQSKLKFNQIDLKTIQITCTNENCDYKTIVNLIEEKNDEKILPDKPNYPIEAANVKILDFLIYCIDISSRMDMEIKFHEEDLKKVEDEIIFDKTLSKEIKEKLLDLITPPISYFRLILFILSNILRKNIENLKENQLQGIQIILLTEFAEEIFQFPNFSIPIKPELILNFINEVQIRRNEIKNEGLLEFRNIKNAINQIAESVIDLKESYPEATPKIFLVLNGKNNAKNQQYFNPLRAIDNIMNDLTPFTFNIINLSSGAEDRILRKVTEQYNGIYSSECTFRALINAFLKNKYATEPFYESIKILQSSPIERKSPPVLKQMENITAIKTVVKTKTNLEIENKSNNKEIIVDYPNYEVGPFEVDDEGDQEIEESKDAQIGLYFEAKKNKKIENWEINKFKPEIERKADHILNSLMNKK